MNYLIDSLVLHNPTIQLILDSLFKSTIILAIAMVVVSALRGKLTHKTTHLIWLSSVGCIALLPLVHVLTRSGTDLFPSIQPIHVIGVSMWNIDVVSQRELLPTKFLLAIYWSVVGVLAARLLLSAYGLLQLHRHCSVVTNNEITSKFLRVKQNLGIKREVSLMAGDAVASPISYGLIKPVVLVPGEIVDWEESIVLEVFQHELSHINRFDWLSLMITHLVCAFLWMNPLLWFAARKLNEEAELICDSAIIETEEDRVRYAANLLRLAKQRQANPQYSLLTQPMYDGGELTMRIKNILEGRIPRNLSRTTVAMFAAALITLSLATSSITLVAADSITDADYLPLRAVAPLYPTRAAEEEVEGWALVSFTVRADGLVDPSSIQVVDAEPPGYFENNSRRAAERFEFQSRIVDGLAVDVPGVQYLFRYELDLNPADFSRPPPEANAR